MSTAGRAPLRAVASRRAPRCPLAVPVRVTVLRSGTAYSIPGRSLDLSESGISAVLAGEVRPTDAVGMEFLLPDLGLGLQAKAVVRHYAPLRCGFEFQGLTRHQQAVLREWARQKLHAGDASLTVAFEPSPNKKKATVWKKLRDFSKKERVRQAFWVTTAVLLLAALGAWWRWQQAWRDLEEQIHRPPGQANLYATPEASAYRIPPIAAPGA